MSKNEYFIGDDLRHFTGTIPSKKEEKTIEKSLNEERFGLAFNNDYKWECKLFGIKDGFYAIRTTKKGTPNIFWRTMQYLIFGNKWRKIK